MTGESPSFDFVAANGPAGIHPTVLTSRTDHSDRLSLDDEESVALASARGPFQYGRIYNGLRSTVAHSPQGRPGRSTAQSSSPRHADERNDRQGNLLVSMPHIATHTGKPSPSPAQSKPALRARRKFLRIFPKGFRDPDYVHLERAYKWSAHVAWNNTLSRKQFANMLRGHDYMRIAAEAVRIESRTNLLFSFEKMALRDAVKDREAAKAFSQALFNLVYGRAKLETRFGNWVDTIGALPRRQTRVLTWPLVTVFGFIARPDEHFFFKPNVTKEAARRYREDLSYSSRPSWQGYRTLLGFVEKVRNGIADLRPRDMIDMQSFLWIQGSEEYPD